VRRVLFDENMPRKLGRTSRSLLFERFRKRVGPA
jgi:hypothetical protein